MLAFIVNVLKALNPRVADTPEQVFAWRQLVVIALIVSLTLSTFNTLQANGWLENVGLRGFVRATQLGDVQRMVKETREDQLVQQILDLTRRYCQSYDARDDSGMMFAFQGLQAVRAKYFNLMGREYPQLMCSMSAQPAIPTQ